MDKSVLQFQRWLQTISRYNPSVKFVIPDGIFGPETTQSVRSFQEMSGLPQTGNVDFETWNAGRSVFDETVELFEHDEDFQPNRNFDMTPGASGPQVFLMQVMLAALAAVYSNLAAPELTGVYDAQTERAVNGIEKIFGGVNGYNDIVRIYKSVVKGSKAGKNTL